MFDFLDSTDQFGLCVLEIVLVRIKEGMHDDEAIFRDGAREHRAAVPAIEGSDIGAATGKAHTKGCAGHDHAAPAVDMKTRSAPSRCASTAGHSSFRRSRHSASITFSSSFL